MTTQDARKAIAEELIEGYYEWLNDEREMPESDYGRKYGWCKSVEHHADCYKSFTVYIDYFFGGRYLPGWVRQGYDSHVIWQLKDEGFLSYKLYSNWDARMRGKTDWFYFNRKTAKAVYTEMKKA